RRKFYAKRLPFVYLFYDMFQCVFGMQQGEYSWKTRDRGRKNTAHLAGVDFNLFRKRIFPENLGKAVKSAAERKKSALRGENRGVLRSYQRFGSWGGKRSEKAARCKRSGETGRYHFCFDDKYISRL